jgi:hypothetical protein
MSAAYTVRRREEGYDTGTQGVVGKRRGAAGQSERTRDETKDNVTKM